MLPFPSAQFIKGSLSQHLGGIAHLPAISACYTKRHSKNEMLKKQNEKIGDANMSSSKDKHRWMSAKIKHTSLNKHENCHFIREKK